MNSNEEQEYLFYKQFYLAYGQLIQEINNLPTRTIETLEVGDYVEFENLIHKTIKTIIFGEYELVDIKIYLLSSYCTDEDRNKVKIIPHQALTLLRELL